MICYRDMTFCNVGKGCTCPEWKRLTQAVWDEARAWWGGDGAPVCVGPVCLRALEEKQP